MARRCRWRRGGGSEQMVGGWWLGRGGEAELQGSAGLAQGGGSRAGGVYGREAVASRGEFRPRRPVAARRRSGGRKHCRRTIQTPPRGVPAVLVGGQGIACRTAHPAGRR